MKKGIDPLFWWGIGICGVLTGGMVLVGVATSPRTATRPEPAAQERRRDWAIHIPGWAFVVPTGIGSGIAGAGAAAQKRRQQAQQGQTATGDGWPVEVEQALKTVTTYTHDRKVAERLMMQCSRQNPDKSIYWVTEKVVQDIVRDRR